MNRLLDDLNPEQAKAVTHQGGPLLLLAGAGSGKTRVLTRRLAWLIRSGEIDTWSVLAVTFTNKAAGEMKHRVEELIAQPPKGLWVQTFHSACLRILRANASAAGLAENFSIYDTGDQDSILRRLLKAKRTAPGWATPGAMRRKIERYKRDMWTPEHAMEEAHTSADQFAAEIFDEYEKLLQQTNGVDFNDLINKSVRLLEEDNDVRDYYRQKFHHVMVDEAQDTNSPQFRLLHALADEHRQLTVVGDDDQSIYGFRGADVTNILEFERHFGDATVLRLEQNYRSTSTILSAANSVVQPIFGRRPKELWTERQGGAQVQLHEATDEYEEAELVIAQVMRARARGFSYDQQAVFFRTNAQSRVFEETLGRSGIPFVMVGARRFFERKEIKDIVAYLRLLLAPDDIASLSRVINVPTRGIGDTTQTRLFDAAHRMQLPPITALEQILSSTAGLQRATKPLLAFRELLLRLREGIEDQPVPDIIQHVVDTCGYSKSLEEEGGFEAMTRLENLDELINQAMARHGSAIGMEGLANYLDQVALIADADHLPEKDAGEVLTLMTIHCAKGLEYPIVHVVGMEEDVFPHSRSVSEGFLDEERRLCYVAFTRAMEELHLFRAKMRRVRGQFVHSKPSLFLSAIPGELVVGAIPQRFQRPPTPARAAFFGSASRIVDRGDGQQVIYDDAEPIAAGTEPGGVGPSAPLDIDVDPENDWQVGVRVVHPKFGQGIIRSVRGSGPTAKLVVDFGASGQRKLVARFAGLQREDQTC